MIAALLASVALGGWVCPARFEPLPRGWVQSDLGPTWFDRGAGTSSWGHSPIRFVNLNDIPRDGIYVLVLLARRPTSPAFRPGRPFRLPIEISHPDQVATQEGSVLPEYRFAGYRRFYDVDLRVDFGRKRPTRVMLARAQSLLRGLRLPNWGPPRPLRFSRCR